MDISTKSGIESVAERDIQDVFDSLCLPENDLVNEAYQEGKEQGEKEGYTEGFNLGVQKSSEFGAEIGFYEGFARGWIALLSGGGEEFYKVISEQIESGPGACSSSVYSEVLQHCQELSVAKLESHPENQKHLKALNKLRQLVESFPTENSKSEDVVALLNNIRAKFKHCCAILKVEASIPSDVKASF